MMHPFRDKLAVWNILHDGGVVEMEGTVPGDVRIAVEIEYLRMMLPEAGDRFVIRLTGCRLAELRRYAADRTVQVLDWAALREEEPEILSAVRQGETVVISMTRGAGTYMELCLQYEALGVFVESGREIPLEELTAAARQYWDRLKET